MMYASDSQCVCGHPWGEHCLYGCTAMLSDEDDENSCLCEQFAVPPAAVEMQRAGATPLPGLES